VKDVDVSALEPKYKNGDLEANAALAAEVLDKVHPYAAEMMRIAASEPKLLKDGAQQCVEKFLKYNTGKFSDLVQLNVAVHECTHMTHWWEGVYRPGPTHEFFID